MATARVPRSYRFLVWVLGIVALFGLLLSRGFGALPEAWVNLSPEDYVGIATVFVLPIFYMHFYRRYEIRAEESSPSPSLGSARRKSEYEVLNGSVERRENSLLVSGSIFVTVSTVILSQVEAFPIGPPRYFVVFGSWAIYSIWLLFFQLTTQGITDATFSRIRGIEGQLGIEAHRYLVNFRNPWRKWVWLLLFDALLIVGFSLLNSNVWILFIPLGTQFATIVFSNYEDKRRKSGSNLILGAEQPKAPKDRSFLQKIWGKIKYVMFSIASLVVLYYALTLPSLADWPLVEAVFSVTMLFFILVVAFIVKRKKWLRYFATVLAWLGVTLGTIVYGIFQRLTLTVVPLALQDWRVFAVVIILVVNNSLLYSLIDQMRNMGKTPGASEGAAR